MADKKFELKKTKVEAAKIEAHATMIKAMNKAMQFVVTNIVQVSKIFMTDTTNMGPEAKVWYAMKRRAIMQEMKVATATTHTPASQALQTWWSQDLPSQRCLRRWSQRSHRQQALRCCRSPFDRWPWMQCVIADHLL
jgi:hypothetical protein